MKKKLIAALMLLFCCCVPIYAAQESLEGRWEGVMVREGAELPVSFDFTSDAKGLKASFDSRTWRVLGIPLRNVSYTSPKAHFELAGDATTIVFDGELNGDTLAGQFRENSAQGTFSLKRIEAKPLPYKQEEVHFQNKDVTLSGTLLIPITTERHAAVVFLHGAGGEGRFGARFLADHLARHGIAALIYDKRGVGASTGDWKRSDFNDLADDALAGIHFLQQRKEINLKQIGIYGHSQGGMIGPLIASRSKDVAFVVSGAGSAVPVYESEINSITNQVRAQGILGDDLAAATRFIKMWINVMRTGEGVEQLDAAIKKVHETKWFPMLHVPPKGNWAWAFYKGIYDYNAADYWEKVSVPTLLIYGERDMYVPLAPSIANIDRALRRARNSDYSIVMLPRASHAFIIEPEANQPFEWWHVAPGFPDLVLAWINQRVGGAK